MFEEEKNTAQQPTDETVAQQASQEAVQDTYRDQFLRLNADFQNFKRRVEKERSEWMVSAQASVLKKILPVFDELDNVVNLCQEQHIEGSSWAQGLELSQKNWQKMILELGVEEIPTSGMFDPELHEGLMQEDVSDKQPGEIVKTFSKGYRFKGTVIRHAKVSVAK
jgi:molecular chaperone GrpE